MVIVEGSFILRFARTTQRQMIPTVIGIRMWNSLHDHLKGCTNVYQFKRCYKNKMLNQYEED